MRFAELVDFFRQMGVQVRETWQQLSASAKVMLVGIGLLCALPMLYFTFFYGGETRYITLADNLTAQQISETISILEAQKVPYKLDETARTINVLPKDRSRMLLQLEQNNLPVGRSIPSGFDDLFKNPDFMSNQWYNNVNFMRAVQGELERQLSDLDFIEYANVFIREADNEYFIEEQIPSEASVVLKLKRPLSPLETKLVVSMVSRAGGTNLHPGNITVASTDGEALHLPADTKFAAIANDKIEYQNTVESRIEEKIQTKLEQMGLRGTVTVGAQIDFDEKEVMESLVTEGTPLSELTTTQNIVSQERLPEGAPGAVVNVPEAAAAPGGTSTEDTMKETLTNHEPSRTSTTTRSDPGNVVRYQVAMVVQGDEFQTVTDDQGNETKSYVGLKKETEKACKAIAQSAVAAENADADTFVTIVDHPFESASMTAVTAALASRDAAMLRDGRDRWLNTGVLVVVALVAFFLLRKTFNKLVIHPSEEKKEEEVREIPEATLEDMRRQEVAAEISQLSLDDPESVAALLRSWMSQSED